PAPEGLVLYVAYIGGAKGHDQTKPPHPGGFFVSDRPPGRGGTANGGRDVDSRTDRGRRRARTAADSRAPGKPARLRGDVRAVRRARRDPSSGPAGDVPALSAAGAYARAGRRMAGPAGFYRAGGAERRRRGRARRVVDPPAVEFRRSRAAQGGRGR